MDISKIFKGLPDSKLSVDELIKLSQQNFFKVGIQERSSNLGGIKYLGFKYVFHRDIDDKLVIYVSLYFYMKGSTSTMYKDTKGVTRSGKKHPRETYLLVAKFPYTTEIKNMKRLYDTPLQIFSSDPSFKYFFAYSLNKMGAVVTDDGKLVDWLGESLTKEPRQNNVDLKVQLTKHFYRFFQFIGNNRPKDYLDPKMQIRGDVRIMNAK